MIAVGGMVALALLGARLAPAGAAPVGPASAAGWTAPALQLSEDLRTVEAG